MNGKRNKPDPAGETPALPRSPSAVERFKNERYHDMSKNKNKFFRHDWARFAATPASERPADLKTIGKAEKWVRFCDALGW
jgi:hypothetical protein